MHHATSKHWEYCEYCKHYEHYEHYEHFEHPEHHKHRKLVQAANRKVQFGAHERYIINKIY